MRSLVPAALLSLTLCVGTAWAQTPAPSPTTQDQKKAISKSCTDQANAKGLHGKARKKFRSECKKAGGKPQ
jgi:psiF repeat